MESVAERLAPVDIEDAATAADCRNCPGRDSRHCCSFRQRRSTPPSPALPQSAAQRRSRRDHRPPRPMLRTNLSASLLLLLSLSGVYALEPDDVFVSQPSSEPYHLRAGDENVELRCSAREQYAERLQWLFVSSPNRQPSDSEVPLVITMRSQNNVPDHYTLVTPATDPSVSKGTYNLVIKKVDFERDDGTFHCQYQGPDAVVVAAAKAVVVVLVRPGPPTISDQSSSPLSEGSLAYAECRSTGGNPAPTMIWHFSNGTEASPSLVSIDEGSQSSPTVSRLQWLVSAEDDGGSISCLISNAAMEPSEEKMRASSRPFTVRYRPRVSLNVPQRLSVEEGKKVKLECHAKGNPSTFRYGWVKKSEFGQPDLGTTEQLTLSVEKDSAGEYACVVTNEIGTGEAGVALDVLYAPRLKVPPVVTVAQGSSATLTCEAEANPAPNSIRWLGPDGRRVEGARMELTEITKEMAGNYTCEATNTLPLESGNEVRNAMKVTELKVLYRPGRAYITVQEEAAVVGSSVTLFCSATEPGEPPAEFRWKAPDQTDYMYNPQTSYSIQNVQLANAGEYWCKPQNQLDEHTIGEGIPGSYVLRVIQPAQLDQPLPTQPLELKANSTAAPIYCEGRGNPAPVITWYKDGEAITDEAGESVAPARWAATATHYEDECADELRCSFRVKSMLKWAGPLRWSDKGRYTCQVSNGQPGAPTSSVFVRVRHRPRIDDHSSRTQAAAEMGGAAEIRCRASALPAPSFRWSFQGDEIQEGGRYTFMQEANRTTDTAVHILRITQVSASDLGSYLCRAANEFGSDSQAFVLKEGGRPEPASGLKVVGTGTTWLRLGWEPGFDGGFAQHFTIELSPLNPITSQLFGDVSTYRVDAPLIGRSRRRHRRYINDVFENLLKYNVSELLPGRKFRFRVMARNVQGEADRWSEMAEAQTREPQPDPAIAKITSAIYNAQEGSLTFKPQLSTPEFCALVWLESAERRGDWATEGCYPANQERLRITPGAANLRLQFMQRHSGVVGNATLAMHAKDVGTGGWPLGTVIAIVAVAVLLLLLGVIAAVCCCVRSRSSAGPKQRSVGNVRVDYEMETGGRTKAISAPYIGEGSLEKVPVEGASSGANTGLSNGDSGVFTTLGSISQPYAYDPAGPEQGYHNGGYGLDQFGGPGDGYAADYPDDYGAEFPDGGYPPAGYYDPYANPQGMVDLNPQPHQPSHHPEEGGSVASGYSTPNQRRVMREIIV